MRAAEPRDLARQYRRFIQFEIVCVLGLLAMFTHMHIFWIAGLLLAMIDFPDFTGLLKRIAVSTEGIAAKKPLARKSELDDDVAPEAKEIGHKLRSVP